MSDAESKACCALAYETEAARWLMGDSFHPGGLVLTERLGSLLDLRPAMRVLDLACGRGTSALFLAERFGCHVTGVDLGQTNVGAALAEAESRGLLQLVAFQQGDAERLPFEEGSFDAVICECAFCLFPDKAAAAAEITRVLRPGGVLGLSDLVRDGPIEPGLDGLMAWIACIADAQPMETWIEVLSDAGLIFRVSERHDPALAEIADRARQRLFAAEVLSGLGKLSWPGFDFPSANVMAQKARTAIAEGRLGYAIAIAGKRRSALSRAQLKADV